MAIAQTGDLNERIQIISKGEESTDEFGDPTPGENQIIYKKLFAKQPTKKADEIAQNLDEFKDTAQFIIRHRRRTEPLITSDMTLIHLVKPENIEYQITAVNYDTQYGQWDVILCEKDWSKMSFSLDEDVTSNLSSLGRKGTTIRNKALRAGRDVVVHNLEENTPYENQSDRSWKAQREMDKRKGHKTTFKHLKDDIVYSGVDQTGATKVGFGKDTYWRAHFVELGTINQAPQPFISTTLQQSEAEYKNIIERIVREELGL